MATAAVVGESTVALEVNAACGRAEMARKWREMNFANARLIKRLTAPPRTPRARIDVSLCRQLPVMSRGLFPPFPLHFAASRWEFLNLKLRRARPPFFQVMMEVLFLNKV